MALDLNKIKETLQKPKNNKVITKASKLQQRLRFHTETSVSPYDITAPAAEFLNWVNALLPKDKYNIFVQLFQFPLPTPAIVENVYRELERVFYSRNSSSLYQFTDSSLTEDWINYRIKNLNEPEIWKIEGWEQMKVSVNSILIVDLPIEQKSDRPEPYFYWLPIESVIDFESKDGKSLEWIIFKQENNRLAVFDNESMRIFIIKDSNGNINTKDPIYDKPEYETKHDLGFCPARFFWSTALTKKEPYLKKNPLTKELSNLDWLLFFLLSKRHLDLYAPYPIYSAYEADCSYANNETGDYCDGGFLRNNSGEYIQSNSGQIEKCPVCSEKRIAGPGSFLEVPVPAEGVDMRNPVQITTIDEASLNYNVKECERLQNNLIISCVGSDGMVSEKEAINETQVIANFESKTSVLNALKTNFEDAQTFIHNTICKLRYGEAYLGCAISWGTEFYVLTVAELYEKYKMAKENGASDAELDSLTNKILETEYRNNPIQLQRMQILKQLEPYRHYSMKEVIEMHKEGLLEDKQVFLKLNFSTFIDKFERENINIVEFANMLPLYQKITLLTQKLYSYVDTIRPSQPAPDRTQGAAS